VSCFGKKLFGIGFRDFDSGFRVKGLGFRV